MKDLENISRDLFDKIRSRFSSVSIGDEEGAVTNVPENGRFFEFNFPGDKSKDIKISLSLDEDGIVILYNSDDISGINSLRQTDWFNFLREIRKFSKKRMLNFDVRDLEKSNLTKRDYKFLAADRKIDESILYRRQYKDALQRLKDAIATERETAQKENRSVRTLGDLANEIARMYKNVETRKLMSMLTKKESINESNMYGTARVSYQNIGDARLVVKHSVPIDTTRAGQRSQKIDSIYVESAEGERFKYPFKHLSGARAMARHVAHGGNSYDSFGKHITGLSEELSKLRKFKRYMSKSSVMAEGLEGYIDVVKERISEIKDSINGLQRESYYKEAFENFEERVFEEVPDDVKQDWISQLTIKSFNEELEDVFPYIYGLVQERSVRKISPEDFDTETVTEDSDIEIVDEYDAKIEDRLDTLLGQFLEKNSSQKPLSEYILSNFDSKSKSFNMDVDELLGSIKEQYGEKFVDPAKGFIENLNGL